MDYMSLISKTRSVRDYKKKEVNKKLLMELKAYINSCQRLVDDIAVVAHIFDNEQVFDKLSGIAGYQGHMLNAPHYLVIFSDTKEHYIENSGCVAADMILKANELEIDCCFITFPDGEKIKDVLKIDTPKTVAALIALGYSSDKGKSIVNATKVGDNYSKSQLNITKKGLSYRIDIEEMVFMKEWGVKASIEQLEEHGLLKAFLYSNLAPSTLNRQPWRYIVDGANIVFALRKDDNISDYEEKIDCGISMLFFKVVVDATLFRIQWKFDLPDKDYKVPDDYKIVAVCNM